MATARVKSEAKSEKTATDDSASDNLDYLPTRREVLHSGAVGFVTLIGLGSILTGKVFAEKAVAEKVLAHKLPPLLSTPALEEGPFWLEEADKRYHRSDLRANLDGTNLQAGLPLNLALTVSHLKNGVAAPLPHAFVYLWIASPLGVYSGEGQEDTADDSYLRGYQVTDATGKAKFLALYPGWYEGRTVHIHARVRTYSGNDPTQRVLTDFETQLFFDDAVTDHVMKTMPPYNQRRDRDVTNKTDRVYNGMALDGTTARASGELTKVHVTTAAAHADATFHLLLDPTKHARPSIPPGGFGGGRPGDMGGPPPEGDGGPPPPGWGPPPDGPPPDGWGGAPPW